MKWIRHIDRISEWTGIAAAWIVVPLTLLVTYEVVMRFLFNAPSNWGYDVCWMLYGASFMMGGAYTLLHKGHVRIDIVYNVMSPRIKAIFDTVVYLVFFLFVTIVFAWAGIRFASESWSVGEHLSTSTWKFPSGPIKTVIPAAYLLLSLQGLAELVRCLSRLGKRGPAE